MTAPFLFEIGVEELPASFVHGALDALPGLVRGHLADARLAHGDVRALGTPRRLAVWVDALADRQRDLSEQVLGPPARVAVADDGSFTKAALGFARKQGVDASALTIEETDKGRYVAFQREEPGRPAADVLPPLLERLVGEIPFRKSMRWGAGDVAFGRPIHWLVALHGDAVVPARFAGIEAGRTTRGHRFLAPDAVEVPRADAYVDTLRSVHVLVDPEERTRRMEEALEAAARDLGGELVPDPFLVGECASLVEAPHVVPGGFDEAFLALPEGVVVSVMRDHQRYFAVRGSGGDRLLPAYLNVVNTALDPATIRRGNDRVLRARLADARFFVEEDRKRSLASRVDDLRAVVFQSKLGTLHDKAERIAALAPTLAPGAEAAAAEAARLAKADLTTLIVGEFPELQGDMGRFYALADRVDGVAADAIRDHYLPRGASDAPPRDPVSAAVGVADRIDTLVGCFGVGLRPSGSADPYALRRAALGIVRTALEGPIDVRLGDLVRAARAAYPAGVLATDAAALERDLDEFFRARLRAAFAEKHDTEVVDACLGAWDGQSVRDLAARVRAVEAFQTLPAYESLLVAFKRTYNIAADAPPGEPDPGRFEAPEERALAERFDALKPRVRSAVEAGDYETALRTVADELREPIDAFFDAVFVMVDDEDLKANRLRLLGGIARTLTRIAHFHVLSTGVG